MSAIILDYQKHHQNFYIQVIESPSVRKFSHLAHLKEYTKIADENPFYNIESWCVSHTRSLRAVGLMSGVHH